MTNKKRKLEGNEEYRFADVYHSANRTPVSTAEVSWNMFFLLSNRKLEAICGNRF